MRMATRHLVLVCISLFTVGGLTTPAQGQAGRLAFDVVSIKQDSSGVVGSNFVERPDGGVTMLNMPVLGILNNAFAPLGGAQIIGVPDWAKTEHYDVRATSTLTTATPEQRKQMLQTMLADRFGLVAHREARADTGYDLVFARSDRRLGSGIVASDVDCARVLAARAANPPPPSRDYSVPPPPCTTRVLVAQMRDASGDKQGWRGDLLEGEMTMDMFAQAIRPAVGGPVVNETGLLGAYRIRMDFDFGRRPAGVPAPPSVPSVFAAVQEQLGLKLESSKTSSDVLVIDHIERPTPD